MPIPSVTLKITTLRRHHLHVAHKTYNAGTMEEIRPGDVYRYVVRGGFYINGPKFLETGRIPVSKGPAWDECPFIDWAAA